MKKRYIAVITVAVAVLFLLFFYGEKDTFTEEKVLVGVSFYPLADFVERVGGERVEVFNITPPGADPHNFEPTARDIIKLHSANIFFYMGEGLDPWAEKAEIAISGINSVKVSRYLDLMEVSKEHHEEDEHYHNNNEHHHEEDENHHNEHHHGKYDPHVWLDPVLAQSMVKVIKDALIATDEEGRDEYVKNAENAIGMLEDLHQRYKEGLSDCQLGHAVISHASLGYLAHRYGFEMMSVSGISPEEEPSPRKMAEVSDMIKKHNIGHIFFETTLNPRIAETISRETGAQVVVFHSLESISKEEIDSGEDYFSLMNKNLKQLRTALKCE